MFEPSDAIDLQERRTAEKSREARPMLQAIHQAAAKAEFLTGHEGWDTYLGYLENAMEGARRNRDGHARNLANPLLADPNMIARERTQLLLCDERIKALLWASQLPADIVRLGAAAKEKLAAIQGDES